MNSKRHLLAALICVHVMLPAMAVANTPARDGEAIDYVDLNIREFKAKTLPFSMVLPSTAQVGQKVLLIRLIEADFALFPVSFMTVTPRSGASTTWICSRTRARALRWQVAATPLRFQDLTLE